MKEIKIRDFRENLARHLNELVETSNPLLVTAPDRRVVIISEAQYDKDKRELYELKATLFNKTHNDNTVLHESLNYLNK